MKQPSLQDWHDWLNTPLGEYVLARERAWLDTVTPDIFGFHAIQLGCPELDLLRESRIVHRLTVAPEAVNGNEPTLRAQFHELPFEPQSIDLCVLPHVLEFTESPHEILREIDRVMRPEGRILIIGFNPWSLFGVKKLWAGGGRGGNGGRYPWQGQFVSLIRMKDWLQLLGFEPSSGKLTCYIPPCETPEWQRRYQFLERAGDRWWGVSGGVYMLEAIKRVQGARLITPKWAEQKVRERKFATSVRREEQRDQLRDRRQQLLKNKSAENHLRLVK